MRVVGLFSPLTDPSQPSGADIVRAFCRSEGHQLAGLFTQGPGESEADVFRQMFAAVKPPSGKPALIVVPDATHFAPDLESMSERLSALRAAGCDVRCLDGRAPDLVLNSLDRLSLEGRSAGRLRRVRRAIMSKASRGEVLGRTPFGYGVGLDGLLQPESAETEVLRDIFAWYTGAARAGSKQVAVHSGVGLRQIAHRLNDAGLKTRTGKAWTPLAVRNILRNPAYIGTYNRYGVMISGAHQPVVDRGVFNIAQAVLDRRGRASGPFRRPGAGRPGGYALSGLLRCSVCGGGMSGLTRKREWKRQDGTAQSKEYRYYECPSGPSRRRQGAAGHPAWRAERLEEAVREALGGAAPLGAAEGVVLAPGMPQQAGRDRSIALAEAAFMQSLRAMAAGRVRADAVAVSLSRLREARASATAEPAVSMKQGRQPGIEQNTGAGEAVDHIIVHRDRVEAVRKPAAA